MLFYLVLSLTFLWLLFSILVGDICNLHLLHFVAIHGKCVRHKNGILHWLNGGSINKMQFTLIDWFNFSVPRSKRIRDTVIRMEWVEEQHCNCKLQNALTERSDTVRMGARTIRAMPGKIWINSSSPGNRIYFCIVSFSANLTSIALSADAQHNAHICIDC